MNQSHYTLCLAYIVIGPSCQWAKDEKALTAYIANPAHGLCYEKDVNGITIKASYRPSDFLVKQEMKAGAINGKDDMEKLRQQYGNQWYFIISFSHNHQEVLNSFTGNESQFSEMLQQLAFGMANNITLVTSQQDTLPLVDYIYPRLYGTSTTTDVMCAFQKNDAKKAEWVKLMLNDPGLLSGNVSFTFYLKDILHTPKLKLQ